MKKQNLRFKLVLFSMLVLASVSLKNIVHSETVDDLKNHTISVYKKVMANYSPQQVRDYFAVRQVSDDTKIIADKGGGFFTTGLVDDNRPVTVYVKGNRKKVMYFTNHNDYATVKEIKKALGAE